MSVADIVKISSDDMGTACLRPRFAHVAMLWVPNDMICFCKFLPKRPWKYLGRFCRGSSFKRLCILLPRILSSRYIHTLTLVLWSPIALQIIYYMEKINEYSNLISSTCNSASLQSGADSLGYVGLQKGYWCGFLIWKLWITGFVNGVSSLLGFCWWRL